MISLGAFLPYERYETIELLVYLRMACSCGADGTLLCVPLNTIKSWYPMDILWLIRNKAVNGLGISSNWALNNNRVECSGRARVVLYAYDEWKIRALPAEPLLVRSSSCGAEVSKGSQLENEPRYPEGFANCRMYLEYF